MDSCRFVRISVWAQNCFFEVKLKCLTATEESAGVLGSQTLQDEAKVKTVTQLHTNDFTLYQQHIRDEGTNSAGIPLRSLLLSPLQTNRRKAARVSLLQTFFFFFSVRGLETKKSLIQRKHQELLFHSQAAATPIFPSLPLALVQNITCSHALPLQRRASPNDITSPPHFLLASQTASASSSRRKRLTSPSR